MVGVTLFLLIRCGAAVDEEKLGAQQANPIGTVFKRHLGFGAGGDIRGDLDTHAIRCARRLLGLGLLLLAPQFLRVANLVHFGVTRFGGLQFQTAVDGVEYHALALGHVENFGAQRHHTGQAFTAGQNRHVGCGAAFGHANADGVLRTQLQQVRRGQFMGADNRSGGQFEMPGFTEQRAQYALLQIPQIVGTFGKQRFAQGQQHRALRLDCIAPGMGGCAALFN
ncbi:hypothetical protein AO284_23295 [Pseudomonas sp. NZIPFR-PS2]|nr:hypothetical protein AO284_23295 [Pseudomonas sp. NZIPFR-PS2]